MTTKALRIPFVGGKAQTFQITLAGAQYTFTNRFNSASACWVLDIDDIAGNSIVTGIPLVTGCDLLAQFPDLALGFQLIVQTNGGIDVVPDFNNLGNAGNAFAVVSF